MKHKFRAAINKYQLEDFKESLKDILAFVVFEVLRQGPRALNT